MYRTKVELEYCQDTDVSDSTAECGYVQNALVCYSYAGYDAEFVKSRSFDLEWR